MRLSPPFQFKLWLNAKRLPHIKPMIQLGYETRYVVAYKLQFISHAEHVKSLLTVPRIIFKESN